MNQTAINLMEIRAKKFQKFCGEWLETAKQAKQLLIDFPLNSNNVIAEFHRDFCLAIEQFRQENPVLWDVPVNVDLSILPEIEMRTGGV